MLFERNSAVDNRRWTDRRHWTDAIAAKLTCSGSADVEELEFENCRHVAGEESG